MFAQTITSSWDERSRRGVTALASFGLQALAVGLLLILPLLRPQGLPLIRQLSAPVSLGEPGEAPVPRPRSGGGGFVAHNPDAIVLRPSTQHSWGKAAPDDGDATALPGTGPNLPGGVGSGIPTGIAGSPGVAPVPVMPAAPPPRVAAVRISQMAEGDLIHKVLPTYPPLARSARIQGQVILQAMISRRGAIENLRVLHGHPMLVDAALAAVRQWRYRPYILNKEPVEVETQITVNFFLGVN
jgi:periplasmic protein TonB